MEGPQKSESQKTASHLAMHSQLGFLPNYRDQTCATFPFPKSWVLLCQTSQPTSLTARLGYEWGIIAPKSWVGDVPKARGRLNDELGMEDTFCR